MTRREPVNAQTPRAGVNDKKVGRLESSGRRERVEEREKGKEVDRWEGTRDMPQDNITLKQDKYKVKDKETQGDIPDRGTKRKMKMKE